MGRYALGGSVGFRDIVGAAAKDSILATNIKQPLPDRLPFPGKGCGSTTLCHIVKNLSEELHCCGHKDDDLVRQFCFGPLVGCKIILLTSLDKLQISLSETAPIIVK